MPTSHELPWLQHEPSTYSYIGRNDAAVNWLLSQKEKTRQSACKTIIILGSGMIEPFTIAALPRAREAQIVAVEIEESLVKLGNKVKAGEKVTWEQVAGVSRHPGTHNHQLLELGRVQQGLSRLRGLGSLEALGEGVDESTFHVSQQLRDRVTFVNSDSLSGLKSLGDADLICDFFVQTNINKSGEPGVKYTEELIEEAMAHLSAQGIYLIGDTGYNHKHTLHHIARLAEARINAGSLVHIINKGNSFSSSWYLAVSKSDLLSNDEINGIRGKIANFSETTGLQIQEARLSNNELAASIDQALYLAYLADAEGLITWSTVEPLPQALLHLATQPDAEFGETIVFPGKNQS
ncbi:MAG TPA: hypothetical protein VD999_02910 [Vitreimonas sp.]|nr:hypothetical protein [Vitreimonas sp.]